MEPVYPKEFEKIRKTRKWGKVHSLVRNLLKKAGLFVVADKLTTLRGMRVMPDYLLNVDVTNYNVECIREESN